MRQSMATLSAHSVHRTEKGLTPYRRVYRVVLLEAPMERISINLKLEPGHLKEIDEGVRKRNSSRPAGAPAWSRTSLMVRAALKAIRSETEESRS